jgi:shikimate dehydrogenase
MTRPYAEVIGDPIAHSKSPLIHNFWLQKLGIDAEYRACHVRPEELEDYFKRRREDAAWRGCNVTLPHKITVMDFVADPGDVRSSIGAVNSVVREKTGELWGTNTDAGGFIAPILDSGLEGEHAIVIGSGGAANAVLFALAQADIGSVTLFSRNQLKGSTLLARFGLKGAVKAIASRLPAAKLLVNASSLGMAGQPALNIDISPLPDDAIVYDIVYAPLETPLLAAAHARGLETVDGLEMLIGQAALAFELFFRAAPPGDGEEELRALLTS